MKRIPKPLYFYQRWKSAKSPEKRAYYAQRLLSMGIYVNNGEEVIAASDTIAHIGRPLADIAVHLMRVEWRTGKRIYA